MFREALGYPTRSPEGGRSVIVGGLALTSIAVCFGIATLDAPYAYLAVIGLFPWLVVRGYYVRAIRTTIGKERPVPPRFDGVRRLLADGATAAGIAIVYLLPAITILGPLVAVQAFETDLSSFPAVQSVPETAITVIVPVIGLFAIVALMSLIGALYVLPVAVARFAHSGRWRDALELRTVVDGAMTEDYAIAWGVSLVMQALLLPVAYLLRILLVGFFLHFIVAVGVRYCYGQGVGTALELASVEPAQADVDGSETNGEREPTSAFVRVDTAAWGVTPGESSEPMSKSLLFDDSDNTATVDLDDVNGGSEAIESDNGGETPEDEEDGWGLPPAVRRVPDDGPANDR